MPVKLLQLETKACDTIGTVPVPWAEVAISSAKIYGSNFIKQHSETVVV